jgi:hypothetical protein
VIYLTLGEVMAANDGEHADGWREKCNNENQDEKRATQADSGENVA